MLPLTVSLASVHGTSCLVDWALLRMTALPVTSRKLATHRAPAGVITAQLLWTATRSGLPVSTSLTPAITPLGEVHSSEPLLVTISLELVLLRLVRLVLVLRSVTGQRLLVNLHLSAFK